MQSANTNKVCLVYSPLVSWQLARPDQYNSHDCVLGIHPDSVQGGAAKWTAHSETSRDWNQWRICTNLTSGQNWHVGLKYVSVRLANWMSQRHVAAMQTNLSVVVPPGITGCVNTQITKNYKLTAIYSFSVLCQCVYNLESSLPLHCKCLFPSLLRLAITPMLASVTQ